MKRVVITLGAIVGATLLAYASYFYAYVPINIYFLGAKRDTLRTLGFRASVVGAGPQLGRPGIGVRIPYEWTPDAAVFQDKKLLSDVVAVVARGHWMNDELLRVLVASMPRLQELWLDGEPINDKSLEILAYNGRIKTLGLFGTEIGTKSLYTIATMRNLEELDLRDVHVDPSVLSLLCANRKMELLRLWGIDVEDKDLSTLTCLHNLRSLEIALTKVTSASVEYLLNFPQLESFDMNAKTLSEPDVWRLINNLPNLKRLDTGVCGLSNNLLGVLKARNIELGFPPNCE